MASSLLLHSVAQRQAPRVQDSILIILRRLPTQCKLQNVSGLCISKPKEHASSVILLHASTWCIWLVSTILVNVSYRHTRMQSFRLRQDTARMTWCHPGNKVICGDSISFIIKKKRKKEKMTKRLWKIHNWKIFYLQK